MSTQSRYPMRPARPIRRARPAIALAALTLAWTAVAPEASAQRVYATIDSLRHIQSVEPRLGPPGTVVEIYTENLPPQARIHVGIGAMRAGFEALAEAWRHGPLAGAAGSIFLVGSLIEGLEPVRPGPPLPDTVA